MHPQISNDLLEFKERAIKHFNENPELFTYALKDDYFLAMKWGLTDNCILVMKLEHCFGDSVNFTNCIATKSTAPGVSVRERIANDVYVTDAWVYPVTADILLFHEKHINNEKHSICYEKPANPNFKKCKITFVE
jgi:hypothetical protein